MLRRVNLPAIMFLICFSKAVLAVETRQKFFDKIKRSEGDDEICYFDIPSRQLQKVSTGQCSSACLGNDLCKFFSVTSTSECYLYFFEPQFPHSSTDCKSFQVCIRGCFTKMMHCTANWQSLMVPCGIIFMWTEISRSERDQFHLSIAPWYALTSLIIF